MVVEDTESTNGWPLGLGNINMRLRAAQILQPTAAPPEREPEPEPEPEPYSSEMPSPSFSSFTSSNLDTESTASFFQDQSVPLGRLIGIRPVGNRGNPHFQNQITIRTRTLSPGRGTGRRRTRTTSPEIMTNKIHGTEHETSQQQQGVCVPLLHNVIVKMSRSKSSSSARH